MKDFWYHVAGKSYSVSLSLLKPEGCQLIATAFKDDFSITSTGRNLAAALQNLNKKLNERTTEYVEHFD